MVTDLCSMRTLIVELKEVEQYLKKSFDLSLNEALCLCHCDEGHTEPHKISSELELSPSRLSRILESLEQKSVVTRTISPTDRRTIVVKLTDKGTSLVRQLHQSTLPLPSYLTKAIQIIKTADKKGEK
ncbi:MAG: MarR family winged helix-turn-helix transcriptional regulator [Sphaerochaetaceae bacterium]|jgi:DNA-binding MarR family transcriptional regulator